MTKSSGSDSKNTLYCSFCGQSQHEVRKLIAGPTVFICDECVELCMDIIREEHKNTLIKTRDGVATPADICQVLDDYVIGQTLAKIEENMDRDTFMTPEEAKMFGIIDDVIASRPVSDDDDAKA